MSEKALNDIKQIITQFNESLKQHLPLLENEVDTLISSQQLIVIQLQIV